MIYVTGDLHGDQSRLVYSKWEKELTKEDYLIVCGDFGFIFENDYSENRFLDDLKKRPYTILFVDGNHENFNAIFQYPVEIWNGGKAHKIRNNIFHLMRGQIFEIEGKTFFTMGGAGSIDKYMRQADVSWWCQELPTNEEYEEAIANLKRANMKVDYVITHTMPKEMILRYGKLPAPHDIELTGFLEWVMYEVDFKHWYCGHWHDDKDLADNFTILFFDVLPLDE